MRHDETPRPPSVATVGRGVVRAAPDAALLSLEVWAELDSPQAAIDEVARRTEALQAVLDGAGVDPAARSTSGVSLTEQWDHKRDERVFRGYRAATFVSVRITDLGVLGQVISEGSRGPQARPHGPAWQVDPSNPAREEACRLAAEDARRKAEAYASALGLRLGAVMAVREPGAREVPRSAEFEASRGYVLSGGGAEMPVETGAVEVTATVSVVFELVGEPA